MKRAFTLVEVCVSIVVMTSGVMGLVALYTLGLRENGQSVEDVASAGFADAVFAPLVAGLSATNLTWQDWCDAVPNVNVSSARSVRDCNGLLPGQGDGSGTGPGWAAYVKKTSDGKDFLVDRNCYNTAKKVFSQIAGEVNGSTGLSIDWPGSLNSGDYHCGLVATRRGSTISLAFRASRRAQMLFAAPVYYTEVHFQGVK